MGPDVRGRSRQSLCVGRRTGLRRVVHTVDVRGVVEKGGGSELGPQTGPRESAVWLIMGFVREAGHARSCMPVGAQAGQAYRRVGS